MSIHTQWRRTHTCGGLSPDQSGTIVTLVGWVHRRRDHGQLVFIDLRDRFGLTQAVVDPSSAPGAHQIAVGLRHESTIALRGRVRERPSAMVNQTMPTGQIEVLVEEIHLFNTSEVLPFPVHDASDAGEALRLKYRYLDLRRPEMRDFIVARADVVRTFRSSLERLGFMDIETPFLYKSTPEGAREFLVPSRVHPGQFYALPQSPQLFKQVLMISGFDRYYQIVKCFRDEDLRADRQPEFTQVDCEMSFVDEDLILETFETVAATVASTFRKEEIKTPFERMPFATAMERYGVDKPDLRFELTLTNVSDLVTGCDFKVFAEAVHQGGIVNTLVLSGAAERVSRKDLEGYEAVVRQAGARGLASAKVALEGGVRTWQSSIAKFIPSELQEAINTRIGAKAGDLILFGAGSYDTTKASLGALRNHLGRVHKLYDPKALRFVWITDFPLFEKDQDSGRILARHHPFTSPRPQYIDRLEKDPLSVIAAAYDLVLNGHEIAGGSVRIHDPDLQARQFRALGISDEDAQAKFGFLLEALRFGAPPHGGIAFGLDRFIMILTGTDAIRDVIPFPKTQKATCLMTGAPSPVSLDQLRDLHVRVQAMHGGGAT